VLLVAAILKGHQLIVGMAPIPGWWNTRWFVIGQIEIEIVVGLWAIMGFGTPAIWLTLITLYTAFSLVTLYKAIEGTESCGCFGAFSMSPWYTFCMDVAAIGALLSCKSSVRTGPRRSISEKRRLFYACAVAGALVAVPSATLLLRASQPIERSQSFPGTGTIVLQPGEWVGRTFPLAAYIDIGAELLKNNWIVLIYRADCEHCQLVVPFYEQLSDANLKSSELPKVALIELPPYARTGRGLLRIGSSATSGRITDQREWFTETPLRIELRDGVVASFAVGKRTEQYP
jgi:hypothetical protein